MSKYLKRTGTLLKNPGNGAKDSPYLLSVHNTNRVDKVESHTVGS